LARKKQPPAPLHDGEAFPVAGDVLAAETRGDPAHASLDAAVAAVRGHADDWAARPLSDRVGLIDRLVREVVAASDTWAAECIAAEGLSAHDPASAEEALVGPYAVLRYLRALRRSLRDIERRGAPRPAGGIRRLANGQAAARIFPADVWDRLMFTGVTADVWMEPDVDAGAVSSTQAGAYRGSAHDGGRVCLVLGAGNISAIAVLDSLTKLFVDKRAVVLKTHPVQEHMDSILEAAMAPLVEAGCLRIVRGGAAVGEYLARHPGVDEIHVTGSDRTYDAIVYGDGDEGRRRKVQDLPINDKPISAELGSVTPVIVVPGRWSASDLAYQAENVASMLTNNAGFNCVTARVVVTHAGWSQRGEFLDALRRRLAATPTRLAFYPGAEARYESFLATHPEGEAFGERAGGRLPWLLIPGLDPARHDDPCFRTEAFCAVFAETAIEAESVPEYLDRAVDFANEGLWGSLNANLIVSGRSMRDTSAREAVERAIGGLRYGTVSVNHWSATSFGLALAPWGAFPGHRRSDIQSGTGHVHNALMFERTQKVVVRAPFRARPKPVWFASHATADRLARAMVRFEAAPSPLRLPRLLYLALRG
jgi:acyl-CoA reductase-like NAD-dependent aldehyde dehydrogenase